ncbi:hypothetical protein BEN49_07665 [Hymenobacter coccineus]|uniref:Uncharacterized protein n=1 Tax=Hymenobacter coccineus TaxID=1908235 RepID=A0A1G1TGK4_9BACT|nr:hypothetical protein BEN49_07665 [Hymenobacter coccineus]
MLFRSEGQTGAELFDHVVEVSEGEAGVLGLLALAVNVEGFGQLADADLLDFGGSGEGERVEAARLIVARSGTNTENSTGC